MRRWFDRSKTFIFVAPVAAAMSDDGGCSSSKTEALSALTEEQFVAQAAGNTFKREDDEIYGYVARDGTMRAVIEREGEPKTDKGTWKFEGETQLCVTWEATLHPNNNCAEMRILKDGKYQWGGHTYTKIAGNPKNI